MANGINVLSTKAMLSHLKVSRWGGRVHDKATSREVLIAKRADAQSGLFTTRLIKKKAFADIAGAEHEARAYHWMHTQPWFDDGPRILPTALYMKYIKEMNDVKGRFDKAVEEFLKEYPAHIAEARTALGDLFDSEYYPSVESMRTKHALEIVITNCPDTQDFRCDLPSEVLDDIKADMEKRLKKQMDSTIADVSERIQDVVGRMAERLKAYSPADKKGGIKATGTFRDSLVDNVRELAELIPAFNMKGDAKITKLVTRMKKELCEFDADVLREDDLVRAKVSKSADDILATVGAFIK